MEPTPLKCFKNDAVISPKISLTGEEFTWNCPAFAAPDFGSWRIEYVPDQLIVETKSLKLYLVGFRDQTAYAEEIVERMFLDFFYYVKPQSLSVTIEQKSRGGVKNTVTISGDRSEFEKREKLRTWVPRVGFEAETYADVV